MFAMSWGSNVLRPRVSSAVSNTARLRCSGADPPLASASSISASVGIFQASLTLPLPSRWKTTRLVEASFRSRCARARRRCERRPRTPLSRDTPGALAPSPAAPCQTTSSVRRPSELEPSRALRNLCTSGCSATSPPVGSVRKGSGADHIATRRFISATALRRQRPAITARTSGITPACWSSPSMSDWIHSSTTLPSAIRKIVIPDVDSRFPVGGCPKYGPRCVPADVQRTMAFSSVATMSSTGRIRSGKASYVESPNCRCISIVTGGMPGKCATSSSL